MGIGTVKDHFESEAREFDHLILTLIPHYSTMVRVLVEAIPAVSTGPLRVLDLGCGTGMVSAHVLQAFPDAYVTCLDLAENMITIAKDRLARYSNVDYVVTDFQSFDFQAEYDAVVSSLALHHLAGDEDKRLFYSRIYRSLSPGGVFYNADVVLATSLFMQTVYMKEWRRFMNQNVSKEEIEGKWIPKYKEEDHPAKLMDQLEWMNEIGFVDVDVIWKYYNFAVYGGIRP